MNAKQQRAHESRQPRSSNTSDHDARRSQRHPVFQDEFQHIGSLRSQSYTNSNFLRVLRDDVRDDSVNAGERQDKTGNAEESE